MDDKYLESSGEEAADDEPAQPLNTYVKDLRKSLKSGEAIRSNAAEYVAAKENLESQVTLLKNFAQELQQFLPKMTRD